VLLNEGGPTLFGDFLAAGVVDELFLTLASQTIGRAGQTLRPGLVQGVEFLPEGAPWFSLISIKQQSEQLYLRYRCTGSRVAMAAVPARA
jgi:riboflavin biosynthesis pyrimidine reductase